MFLILDDTEAGEDWLSTPCYAFGTRQAALTFLRHVMLYCRIGAGVVKYGIIAEV